MTCHESMQDESAMNVTRFQIPFFSAFFLLATNVLTRVAAQGLEQGLLSTLIELSMNRVEAGIDKVFPSFTNLLGGSREA